MDYPTIDPKLFRGEKSAYEQNCEKLNDSLCQVFNYNVWLDSAVKFEFEALLVVICVEFRFLHMMNFLKELYEWRMGRLLNMRHSFFLDLLHKVAARMQTLTDFVRKSHRLLREMLTEDNILTMKHNQLVKDFCEQTDWLYAMTADGEVRRLANRLFKEQELHYNPAMFVTRGESLSDHALAVMNSLIVLSLPTAQEMTDDEYKAMFDKSYGDFLNSEGWKNRKPEWMLAVESKGEIFVQHGYGTKGEFLKGIWNQVYRHEDELLNKFGIQHISVNSGNGKAIMSRRLFESLNRKSNTDDSDPPQMTDADLREYFLCLAQRQYLTEEIGKLPPPSAKEPQKEELPQSPAKKAEKAKVTAPSKKTFMKHEADERKLPSVMRDANKQCLDGQHTLVEGSVVWKDYHVAVCLLFYLCDSNNADGGLFSGLGRAFYKSFDKKEFLTMCSYERFNTIQKKLRDEGFKKVIACKSASEFDDKKMGHGTMKMWYEFYHRLLPIFKLHLPERDPAQEKNGLIKLT